MGEKGDLQIKAIEVENIIQKRILFIRGHKVMLDTDIAHLYQTETRIIVQAVKRNLNRFPVNFMFQITAEEYQILKSQSVISKRGRGGRRYLPYAFTEHGVAMLSSVLNSETAIQMNIFIVQSFIKMRESLDSYKDLALKVEEIEKNQIKDHAMLKNVHEVVRHLLEPPLKPKEKMGFNKK